MPSILTHAAVGVALATALRPRDRDARWWTLAALLPVIPDADTPFFGADGVSTWAHRGATHSLGFAAVLAVVAVIAFYRRDLRDGRERPLRATGLAGFFFLATATHGLLDAFTSGGAGIMLLWPISTTRWFAPARPVAVSPLSIHEFFGEWGAAVLKSEILWIWLPFAGLVVLAEGVRRLVRRSRTDAPSADSNV